jgi:hypothetical protein
MKHTLPCLISGSLGVLLGVGISHLPGNDLVSEAADEAEAPQLLVFTVPSESSAPSQSQPRHPWSEPYTVLPMNPPKFIGR